MSITEQAICCPTFRKAMDWSDFCSSKLKAGRLSDQNKRVARALDDSRCQATSSSERVE
jgi:hypothetical protein